jgi:signal transduction histidine kinase
MRRLIADLRPSALDELGLGPALEALGERTSMASAVSVELNINLESDTDPDSGRLASETEDTIYRLVQEALNNAVQHGETDRARVDVTESERLLRVRVSDEGCGFDPNAASDGFGLVGMRERIGLAGGTLELQSAPGDGTTIVAELPARYRDERNAGTWSALGGSSAAAEGSGPAA